MKPNPAVLYVEDDANSRKIMRMLLLGQMRLSDVTIFPDSIDFPARIDTLETTPDVIFLDIHMLPHNGFEMLDMLRQNPRFDTIPVIALTASVMNEEVHRLRLAGFNGCLSKPLDLDTFPLIFDRILDGEAIWHIFS